MKNRNVKVIDEHNIDRNANVMFALELDGSEYVVYWIERDQDSNNVFVSKVLRNLDGTYNMLNIDDADKKKDVAEIVKVLITSAVSDQNDKMLGTTTTLSNGKVVKLIDVSFNKEQSINVSKTYITTVKKEVTKVAENYYDVVAEENKVADVLTSAATVVEPVVDVFPDIVAPVVEAPVVMPAPEVAVMPNLVAVTPEPVVAASTPVVETPAQTIDVQPTPLVVTPAPITVAEPVVQQPVVAPVQQPAVETVVATPVVNVVTPAPEPAVVAPTPVTPTPVVAVEAPVTASQPLVFNAASETNLNAALGEVANSTAIPVENIQPVREFGVDAPVAESVVQQPVVAPVQQPVVENNVNTGKAGFANSKFFMVVAIAFFLASCIFLGYEVYNYFQLVK